MISSNSKEILYSQLNILLEYMENNDQNTAKEFLADLISKVYYDQL
jgi:hypothetical protein